MRYPFTYLFLFFFNDTATTEIYTLSLHDALPISHHVAREVVGIDHELGIIAPLVGIADFLAEGAQLADRLSAGRVTHPFERVQPGVQSRDQVIDHVARAAARVGREGLFDVCRAEW